MTDSGEKTSKRKCAHAPRCPSAFDADAVAASTVAFHPEQGWSLLCNGVVVFEDTGEILPDGRLVAPHRPTDDAGSAPPRPEPPGGTFPGAVRGR